MQPTLYRMWGPMGCLLYIGRTINPPSRLREHQASKDWWDDIEAITLEHFDTLDELIAAESAAIRDEHPVHNIAGDSLRKRIAAIGLEIDECYGTLPGTSLEAIYDIYWPPEMCTPRQFEIVYAMAERNLRVAQRVMAGIALEDAFELIDQTIFANR